MDITSSLSKEAVLWIMLVEALALVALFFIAWHFLTQRDEARKSANDRERQVNKLTRKCALWSDLAFSSQAVEVKISDLPEGLDPRDAFAAMVPSFYKEEAGEIFYQKYGGNYKDLESFRGFVSEKTAENQLRLITEIKNLNKQAEEKNRVSGFLASVIKTAKATG